MYLEIMFMCVIMRVSTERDNFIHPQCIQLCISAPFAMPLVSMSM